MNGCSLKPHSQCLLDSEVLLKHLLLQCGEKKIGLALSFEEDMIYERRKEICNSAVAIMLGIVTLELVEILEESGSEKCFALVQQFPFCQLKQFPGCTSRCSSKL